MRPAKSTLVYFGSQLGTSLAGFLATLYFARVLGAAGLGTYAIVVALLFWLNVPFSAIGGAMTKRVSEGIDRGQFLAAGLLLNLVVAGVVAGVVLAAGSWVNGYVGMDVSGLLALLVMAQVLFTFVTSGLQGQKRVASSGTLTMVERVVRTILQAGLVTLGFQVTGLVEGHVAALFLSAVGGALILDVRLAMPTREQFRSLLSFARYSWLGTLKTRAFGWMDTIVLAVFVAPALVGIYEVSWNLASVLALASVSVQQTVFPEMSELASNAELDRVSGFLNDSLAYAGVLLIPGIFGAMVLSSDILKIYRPEFTQGAVVLVVLVVARTAAAYESQFMSTLNAIDRPDAAFRVNLLFILVNLLLNVALIYEFGWYGAAVATTLSSVAALVVSAWLVADLLDTMVVPYREVAKQLAASLVMAVAVYATRAALPVHSHYVTIGLVGLGGLIYVAVLLAISTRIRTLARSLVPTGVSSRIR